MRSAISRHGAFFESPCIVFVAKVLYLNDSRGSLSDSAALGSRNEIEDWSSSLDIQVIVRLIAE